MDNNLLPTMRFSNMPIRQKLITIVLTTCSAVLLLTCTAFFAYEFLTFRQTSVRQLATLGQIIATNSTAALAFDNHDDATEVLAALKAERHIVSAALYDRRGSVFAKFPASLPDTAFPRAPLLDGSKFTHGYLIDVQPVVQGDRRLGTVYLRADMEAIYERFRLYAGIAILVIAASFLLAYILSRSLQRRISQPLLALAETATAISARQDYSVRATKLANDEIGLLTDAFNHMLTRIHEDAEERVHVAARLRAQVSRLDLLNRITHAIGERQDLPSIFSVMTRNLEDNLPIDFGCVCLYNPFTDLLTVASVGEQSTTSAKPLGLEPDATIAVDDNGLTQCVVGQLVYEPDTKALTFPFAQRLATGNLRSLVAAPLMVEGKVFGILLVARRDAHAFTSADCEFLRQLCEHVALAARQAKLYGELQQAYDDLRQSQRTVLQQERLRALGTMASGIAHDINNAISPAALYVETLLERDTSLSAQARDYLGTIQRAIEDVANTVSRMREFYRQREPQLQLAPIDLNSLVRQIIDLTRVRWRDVPQERGIVITLETQLAPNLPKVMGAEGEIRDALTNLVFNAVDAMVTGGTLTIRTCAVTEDGTPTTDLSRATAVHIDVCDTGIGMDEETKRRSLEPFFTTKGERGTGLGLAMVYGMVQRHSADIDIASTLNEGTRVRLIFPVSSAIVSPSANVVAPSSTQRLRILVVDDDPTILKSLRDILEADGHIVTIAEGGDAGIRTFESITRRDEAFSVVITDLGMPHVDGRKVAATIKSISPETPVILLTGWGQRLLAEQDIPPHVDQLLNKPPKLQELRRALAEVTAQSMSA